MPQLCFLVLLQSQQPCSIHSHHLWNTPDVSKTWTDGWEFNTYSFQSINYDIITDETSFDTPCELFADDVDVATSVLAALELDNTDVDVGKLRIEVLLLEDELCDNDADGDVCKPVFAEVLLLEDELCDNDADGDVFVPAIKEVLGPTNSPL